MNIKIVSIFAVVVFWINPIALTFFDVHLLWAALQSILVSLSLVYVFSDKIKESRRQLSKYSNTVSKTVRFMLFVFCIGSASYIFYLLTFLLSFLLTSLLNKSMSTEQYSVALLSCFLEVLIIALFQNVTSSSSTETKN